MAVKTSSSSNNTNNTNFKKADAFLNIKLPVKAQVDSEGNVIKEAGYVQLKGTFPLYKDNPKHLQIINAKLNNSEFVIKNALLEVHVLENESVEVEFDF